MRLMLVVGMFLLLSACASPARRVLNAPIPQGYLEALAAEEGVSVDEARKMVVDARAQSQPYGVGDVQSGRRPVPSGATPIRR